MLQLRRTSSLSLQPASEGAGQSRLMAKPTTALMGAASLRPSSRNDCLNNMAVHVGQAEVASIESIGELFVI